jgi:hypothetical protein
MPGCQLVAGTILEDGDGNPQLEALNTVTFEDHHGKTKQTLRAHVIKWRQVGHKARNAWWSLWQRPSGGAD